MLPDVRGRSDATPLTQRSVVLRRATGRGTHTGGKQFAILKQDPRHPSLHSKRVHWFHSVRVGAHDRALAADVPDGVLWFWMGAHAEYDRIVAYRALQLTGDR